jgi:putative transposase
MIEFKGSHFEREVILWGIRWYVADPISYRQLEEMLEERGVAVDHSTLNRWVMKYVPLLDQQFRVRKRPVGSSWRLVETYVKVKGNWKYLYRAVDKAGATVDFLLTAKRDRKAAQRFYARQSVSMARQRRSRSTKAAPTQRRLKATTRRIGRTSKSHKTNI